MLTDAEIEAKALAALERGREIARRSRRKQYAKIKQDPERLEKHRQESRERMALCRERNRDAINARRRERYAEKKAQQQQPAP